MNLFKRLVIAVEKIADRKEIDFSLKEVEKILIANVRYQETMMKRLKLQDLERRYFYLKEKNETLTEDEKIEIQVWEKNYKGKVE